MPFALLLNILSSLTHEGWWLYSSMACGMVRVVRTI
ncbi:protein of unknown function [Ralstonia solanacearum CFBP2957]|nr:protein of unknown function [Ralstonia solanacearum CFBP2957]